MATPLEPKTHSSRVRTMVDEFLHDSAVDWRSSIRVVVAIAIAPAILSIVTIVVAVVHRPTFDLLTSEDSLGEWMQVAFWLGALVLALGIVRRLLDRRESTLAALFVLLSIGIVLIIGEEISWGQRLLGFETPEALEAVNRQDEANLHNVLGVQTAFSWAMFVVGLYGTLAPLWATRKWGQWRHWAEVGKYTIPHPLLVPYFLLLFVWRFYRNLFEPPAEYYVGISEFGEMTELVLALAFFLFLFHQRQRTIDRD